MLSTSRQTLLQQPIKIQSRSVYIPPGGKSILTRRLPRRLRVGDTRPPIYHKFECKVELSDGSTVTRQSQFPKVEWRYLSDIRNAPKYNPTRTNLKTTEIDSGGRMAKFQKKYGFTAGVEEDTEVKDEPKKVEKKVEKEKTEDIPVANDEPLLSDDFEDLLGENFVPVQSGGKLAQRKKKGKK